MMATRYFSSLLHGKARTVYKSWKCFEVKYLAKAAHSPSYIITALCKAAIQPLAPHRLTPQVGCTNGGVGDFNFKAYSQLYCDATSITNHT